MLEDGDREGQLRRDLLCPGAWVSLPVRATVLGTGGHERHTRPCRSSQAVVAWT